MARCWRLLVLAWLAISLATTGEVRADASSERFAGFAASIEAALAHSDQSAYGALIAEGVDADTAAAFVADLVHPGARRAVVRVRDAQRLVDGAERVLIEVFVEFDGRGRVATLAMELIEETGADGPEWRIRRQESLGSVDGLYRLAIDPSRQFAVRDLEVRAEDLTLTVPRGTVFVAEAEGGATALVLLGEGVMRFSPRPPAERVQVRIFSGQDELETPFTAAFIRMNPVDFDQRISSSRFDAVPVDRRQLARARAIFDEDAAKSFTLDLGDLSPEPWSLVPGVGDFLAEVRTRRFRTLTYVRSSKEPEDITLFDRQRRRNISVYPSLRRLQARGPFYNQDDLADIHVLDYQIDASYVPERFWLEGQADLLVRVHAFAVTTLTLRFADTLSAHAVVSDRHGRLLSMRVRGQNSLLVSLPTAESRGSMFRISVRYSGRLEPPAPDREVVAVEADQVAGGLGLDTPGLVPESRWVLTNRSPWYPQSPSGNYATGRLRLTVPAPYSVVASGAPAANNPEVVPATAPGGREGRQYVFVAGQPLRYFSWLITRLSTATTGSVEIPPEAIGTRTAHRLALEARDATHGGRIEDDGEPGLVIDTLPERPRGAFYSGADITIVANTRQVGRARALLGPVTEILGVYGGIVGDMPFPTFTLAVVDDELPGGHSPGYFAILHQPLPTSPFFWRNDPVYFDTFPAFFLAHELAHQFWGHAVGSKNYREQWLSEGFAQYFAYLYAEASNGSGVARDIMRRMQRSATSAGPQGPIWLGYRLGHIKGDSRVFRSVVYNKGAVVLHMLRRLVGEQAFFEALGRFYHDSRFRKVGTDDLQAVFEEVTGRPLGRFFERWVFEQDTPQVSYGWAVDPEGHQLVVEFEQHGLVYDVPVTVAVTLASGQVVEHIVRLTEHTTRWAIDVDGPVRGIGVNDDHAALGTFRRR